MPREVAESLKCMNVVQWLEQWLMDAVAQKRLLVSKDPLQCFLSPFAQAISFEINILDAAKMYSLV